MCAVNDYNTYVLNKFRWHVSPRIQFQINYNKKCTKAVRQHWRVTSNTNICCHYKAKLFRNKISQHVLAHERNIYVYITTVILAFFHSRFFWERLQSRQCSQILLQKSDPEPQDQRGVWQNFPTYLDSADVLWAVEHTWSMSDNKIHLIIISL